MIPAEEISDKVGDFPLHINASNIREPLAPVGGRTVSEAITNNLRAVEDQAGRAGREILAHLNHPNFHYAVTPHDLAHAVLERHFEVFNGHPHVNQRGDGIRPGVERIWDIANTIRLVDLGAAPLYGIATDDSHNYHPRRGGSRPGRGWVMVRSTHLTPESIIRAIKAGDCYASTGVTLARVDGPVGEYALTGRELYVRAVVTSSKPPERPVWKEQRRQAWTQPVGWQPFSAAVDGRPPR
jgi:hypothetical protein